MTSPSTGPPNWPAPPPPPPKKPISKTPPASTSPGSAAGRPAAAPHRSRRTHRFRAAGHLHLQPTLDESWYDVWGELPGYDGRLFDKALQERADQLPAPLTAASRAQRNADALVSIAQDSLTGTAGATERNPAHHRLRRRLHRRLHEMEKPARGSPTAPESDPPPSNGSSAKAPSKSSPAPRTANRSPSATPAVPSHPNCAASCSPGTEAAPPTAAPAATGSNPTMWSPGPTAAPPTRTTSPPCAGTTTTWSSTAAATPSTPTAHPAGSDSDHPPAPEPTLTKPAHRRHNAHRQSHPCPHTPGEAP